MMKEGGTLGSTTTDLEAPVSLAHLFVFQDRGFSSCVRASTLAGDDGMRRIRTWNSYMT
jgi:hypothetical protein